MSTATMRLRRAGAGGLAAAVIAGTLVATAGSALAWSGGTITLAGDAGTLLPSGGAATAASPLVVTLPSSWNVGDSFTARIANPNNCTTSTNFAGWTAATFAVTWPSGVTAGTVPNLTVDASSALQTSACASLGKIDTIKFTFNNDGTANTATQTPIVTITHSIQVGSTVPTGPLNVGVTAAGLAPVPAVSPTSVPVGTVASSNVTVSATPAVIPQAGGTAPTVTVKEIVPGAITGAFTLTFSNAVASISSATKATVTGSSATAAVTDPTTGDGSITITPTNPSATSLETYTISGVTLKPTAIVTVDPGLVVKATAAGGGISGTAAGTVGVDVKTQNTGGSDRYYTAAALYNAGFPVSSNPTSVILASGANFPDALSASALAGASGAGIMLTTPTALPAPTAFAISARIGSLTTVYIIGGTGAVSAAVAAQVTALGTTAHPLQVVRLGGSDRYATDQLVNDFASSLGGGLAKTAVVATGTNFADALAVGPEVVSQNYGMVLTDPNSLSTAAAATLVNNGFTSVIIVGGTGAVSANVESQIKALGITVAYRLAGTDRTQTAAQIATWATIGVPAVGTTYAAAGPLTGFNKTIVHVARGDIFADALAAGPVAAGFAGTGTVILLTVNPTTLGTGATAYVSGLAGLTTGAVNVGTVNGLGLGGAVPASQLNSVALSILG